jgi:spermidine synthase
MDSFTETLYQGYSQALRIEEVYFERKTEHQHLLIFRHATFGRVMALDGVVQTTEKDEFIYHEMLTHVPLLAHGSARRVLIIGGGDGGMLREVLKHPGVDAVTQVEIDKAVIEMSREFLPNHSQGAFDDPRFSLMIGDGFEFVRDTRDQFDVIIVDSTDPIGPGEQLFSHAFHAACKSRLLRGGVLVTQNGVVFMQPDEVRQTAANFRTTFADWHFYVAAVPTYVGGAMAFAWGSDDPKLRQLPVSELQERYTALALDTRYYTPEVHAAAFALPRYVLNLLSE